MSPLHLSIPPNELGTRASYVPFCDQGWLQEHTGYRSHRLGWLRSNTAGKGKEQWIVGIYLLWHGL